MTINEAISKLDRLKRHAKDCIEGNDGKTALAFVDAEDIEALATAKTALERLRIVNGVFDQE